MSPVTPSKCQSLPHLFLYSEPQTHQNVSLFALFKLHVKGFSSFTIQGMLTKPRMFSCRVNHIQSHHTMCTVPILAVSEPFAALPLISYMLMKLFLHMSHECTLLLCHQPVVTPCLSPLVRLLSAAQLTSQHAWPLPTAQPYLTPRSYPIPTLFLTAQASIRFDAQALSSFSQALPMYRSLSFPFLCLIPTQPPGFCSNVTSSGSPP